MQKQLSNVVIVNYTFANCKKIEHFLKPCINRCSLVDIHETSIILAPPEQNCLYASELCFFPFDFKKWSNWVHLFFRHGFWKKQNTPRYECLLLIICYILRDFFHWFFDLYCHWDNLWIRVKCIRLLLENIVRHTI